jgi:hypothetical protein
MGLISTVTLKTISDIADVIEISLLNSIEAQKEIWRILWYHRQIDKEYL